MPPTKVSAFPYLNYFGPRGSAAAQTATRKRTKPNSKVGPAADALEQPSLGELLTQAAYSPAAQAPPAFPFGGSMPTQPRPPSFDELAADTAFPGAGYLLNLPQRASQTGMRLAGQSGPGPGGPAPQRVAPAPGVVQSRDQYGAVPSAPSGTMQRLIGNEMRSAGMGPVAPERINMERTPEEQQALLRELLGLNRERANTDAIRGREGARLNPPRGLAAGLAEIGPVDYERSAYKQYGSMNPATQTMMNAQSKARAEADMAKYLAAWDQSPKEPILLGTGEIQNPTGPTAMALAGKTGVPDIAGNKAYTQRRRIADRAKVSTREEFRRTGRRVTPGMIQTRDALEQSGPWGQADIPALYRAGGDYLPSANALLQMAPLEAQRAQNQLTRENIAAQLEGATRTALAGATTPNAVSELARRSGLSPTGGPVGMPTFSPGAHGVRGPASQALTRPEIQPSPQISGPGPAGYDQAEEMLRPSPDKILTYYNEQVDSLVQNKEKNPGSTALKNTIAKYGLGSEKIITDWQKAGTRKKKSGSFMTGLSAPSLRMW
jgi:hypothetical protein